MRIINPPDLEPDLTPDQDSGILLGHILVKKGKIEENDIDTIVKHARRKHLRFGEAARELRLITRKDLDLAMAEQFNYPFLAEGDGDYSPELIAAYRPFSKKGRALHSLQSKLLQHWDSDESQSLAIVGSNKNHGCSYIAANLAIIFSQLGQRTLLIDADILNAHLHQLFNISNNAGLSAVLAGRTPVNLVIKKLPLFRNLSLISAGVIPPNATELLGRKALKNILAELRGKFDMVIVDTPALRSDSGADLIAQACGSSLVVLRQNYTSLKDAQALLDVLREKRVNIIGTVMTDY
ncbi:MAG: polysaccharide biosynthesis tyrosine autokinase [Gammaproteobacteria bacterium]|nr:polysaccharide biosynthesis tyrosine autokinase [Gammaproteobacteria bacterium]MCP4928648.1 polysaccharide biosynthesis tyrosine autokinase [Gammaproteobacteria bacterium]